MRIKKSKDGKKRLNIKPPFASGMAAPSNCCEIPRPSLSNIGNVADNVVSCTLVYLYKRKREKARQIGRYRRQSRMKYREKMKRMAGGFVFCDIGRAIIHNASFRLADSSRESRFLKCRPPTSADAADRDQLANNTFSLTVGLILTRLLYEWLVKEKKNDSG